MGSFPETLIDPKKQQQHKRKNFEIGCSDEKKGKRKFPYANDLKYWDDFNITQLGGAASQPTMIRIMNGAQRFALSAFTSKQKSALK